MNGLPAQAGAPLSEFDPAGLEAGEVDAALTRALASLGQEESLLERFLEWLAPHLETNEVRQIGNVLLIALGTLAIVGLVLLLTRAWSAYRAPVRAETGPETSAAPDVRARVRALAAQAAAARERGELRLALRLALHALLLALGGRGDLELNAAWTNRELLRRGMPSRAVLELLEPLVRELEPKEFGRAEVAAADVERLEALLAPHVAPQLARAGGSR